MKGAPIQNAMAASRAFLAERKKDLPVAIVVFGPNDSVLTRLHDGQGAARGGGREDARDVRGNAHLRRAHRTPSNKAKDQGLERTTVVLLSDGTDFGTSNSTPRRGAAGARRTRTSGSSRSASSPPQYTPETLKSAREAHRRARTSRRTTPPSSSRSSRRSDSSSPASTSSRTARCFRPSRRRSSWSRSRASRPRRPSTRPRRSTSRRRARSRRPGSTRSSRRRG